jgi:hypothetical protein
MCRGYLRTMEAFLAVTILLFALYQVQINIPAEIPPDHGLLRLNRIAQDIANIYCYSSDTRRSALEDNSLEDVTLEIPPDIDYRITLYDQNWNILDTVGNSTTKEKAVKTCLITGYIQGNQKFSGIRYIKVETWFR